MLYLNDNASNCASFKLLQNGSLFHTSTPTIIMALLNEQINRNILTSGSRVVLILGRMVQTTGSNHYVATPFWTALTRKFQPSSIKSEGCHIIIIVSFSINYSIDCSCKQNTITIIRHCTLYSLCPVSSTSHSPLSITLVASIFYQRSQYTPNENLRSQYTRRKQESCHLFTCFGIFLELSSSPSPGS